MLLAFSLARMATVGRPPVFFSIFSVPGKCSGLANYGRGENIRGWHGRYGFTQRRGRFQVGMKCNAASEIDTFAPKSKIFYLHKWHVTTTPAIRVTKKDIIDEGYTEGDIVAPSLDNVCARCSYMISSPVFPICQNHIVWTAHRMVVTTPVSMPSDKGRARLLRLNPSNDCQPATQCPGAHTQHGNEHTELI